MTEHLHASHNIRYGHLLGCRYNHRTVHLDLRDHRQVNITRSRGHINQQKVQAAPHSLMQKLLQGICGHCSAPHQRIVGIDEEADRHQLDVHTLSRHDVVVAILLHCVGQIILHAKHLVLRGAVNISIQHAHAVTHITQRECEVGRNGRFAYATLTRCYGDDLAHFDRCALALGLWRTGSTLLDHYGDVACSGRVSILQCLLHKVADAHGKGIASLGKTQYNGYLVLANRQLLHHATCNNILLRLGVYDRREEFSYLLFHNVCSF